MACSRLCSVHWIRCLEVPMFLVPVQAEPLLEALAAGPASGNASLPEFLQPAQLSNHLCHRREHPPSI